MWGEENDSSSMERFMSAPWPQSDPIQSIHKKRYRRSNQYIVDLCTLYIVPLHHPPWSAWNHQGRWDMSACRFDHAQRFGLSCFLLFGCSARVLPELFYPGGQCAVVYLLLPKYHTCSCFDGCKCAHYCSTTRRLGAVRLCCHWSLTWRTEQRPSPIKWAHKSRASWTFSINLGDRA